MSVLQMAEFMAPTEIIPVLVKADPSLFQKVQTKIASTGIDGATKRFANLYNNIQDFFPPLTLPSLSSIFPGVSGFNIGLPPPPIFPPPPFARINIPEFNIFNLALVRKDLDTLTSIEGVTKIYHDAPVKLAEASTPQVLDKRGWLLPEAVFKAYGLDRADKQGFTGAGVKVAVLDTGWQPTPSLPWVESYAAFPFPPGIDENGHGSWCAHWIGGKPINYQGIGRLGGLSPAVSLMTVKVLGYGIGTGTTCWDPDGHEHCAEPRISCHQHVPGRRGREGR